MTNALRIAVVTGSLLTFGTAFAKGGSKQTHHCKLADGNMDMTKTKAQCKAAKGTWAKDEAAPPPPAVEKK